MVNCRESSCVAALVYQPPDERNFLKNPLVPSVVSIEKHPIRSVHLSEIPSHLLRAESAVLESSDMGRKGKVTAERWRAARETRVKASRKGIRKSSEV